MGVNWKRIIKDQARGVDPVTAFNREQKRMREEREPKGSNNIPASTEEWIIYFTKALKLDEYAVETLTHDLNNLRADEWLDEMINANISNTIISQFKTYFNIA